MQFFDYYYSGDVSFFAKCQYQKDTAVAVKIITWVKSALKSAEPPVMVEEFPMLLYKFRVVCLHEVYFWRKYFDLRKSYQLLNSSFNRAG